MSDLGVCSDKEGTVSVQDLLWLGAQWDRWTGDPVYVEQQKARARLLRIVGIKLFLTSDMTSYARFGDPWDPAVRETAIDFYAGEFGDLVTIHNPTNEPDGVQHESSTMPPPIVNHILWYSRQKWPASVDLAAVGGVTGQLAYYADIELQWVQLLDDHLYAKFAPVENPSPDFSLRRAIDERVAFARRTGLRGFLMSEIGLNAWQVGEARQAEFTKNTLGYVQGRSDVALCLNFCVHPYEGWGLLRQDGTWKPAADEFRALRGNPNPQPQPIYQLGFEQWHAREPWLLGDPLINEHNVYPGAVQTQKTTNGVLIWVAGQGHAFIGNDNKVRRWREDWSESEEVAA